MATFSIKYKEISRIFWEVTALVSKVGISEPTTRISIIGRSHARHNRELLKHGQNIKGQIFSSLILADISLVNR